MNLFKNQKLIYGLLMFVFVVAVYTCLNQNNNKEYFVVKMGPREQEILLDHTDFAEIMNGLKPKSVSGTFTKDDLSELIREFKRHGLNKLTEQHNNRCSGNKANRTDCRYANTLINLVKEAASVSHPDTNRKIRTKDEWIQAIVNLASDIYLQR